MKKGIVLVLLCLLSLFPARGLAAQYEITSYLMTVDVEETGSAWVSEELVYRFDGEYNGILSAFDVGDVEGIEDLSLYVDGDILLKEVPEMEKQPFTYTAHRQGDLLKVQAYAPGGEGERTFRYTYRLAGLCGRYQDAARLNYKLIGTENEAGLQNARVHIRLPGEVLNAWAHGAMEGAQLRAYENTLEYGPFEVRQGQFAEAHILFDAASLSQAVQIDRPILEEARALEAEIERARELRILHRRERVNWLSGFGVLYAGALAWILHRARQAIGFRKKLAPSPDTAPLSGLHAAVAERIFRGAVGANGLTGTVLELARAGAVEMRQAGEEDRDIAFFPKNFDAPGLAPHQRYALLWLFEQGPLYPDHFDRNGETEQAEAYVKRFGEYARLVKEEARKGGYWLDFHPLQKLWIPLMAVLGAALSIGLFVFGGVAEGIGTAALVLLLIVQAVRLKRLSDKGERVKSALLGFSQLLKEGGLKAGREFLPLAAALGLMGEFFENLPEDNGEEDWYYGYSGYGMVHMQSRMHHAHTQAEKTHSQSSSSGGSSSGGGGGGGGHGAW